MTHQIATLGISVHDGIISLSAGPFPRPVENSTASADLGS